MNHRELAEFLFPHIEKTPEDYEAVYPPRDLPRGAMVTRLGPSPTGFIHLGNLFGAFADERLARQSGGVFYLRIEDTDEKRRVEGAVELLLRSLSFFGVDFDEGAAGPPESAQSGRGAYGPYCQSLRAEIYQCYAKALTAKGLAYPCFLTEEEISGIRAEQEARKETPGIYGVSASCRDLSPDEVRERILRKESYVIRLRASGRPDSGVSVSVEDGIRGTLTMPENFQDAVLLKANGIPTYHFAHVIDDHLMRTTHVVRGAEWLSSLPLHIQLFETLGFSAPVYCHTAQLMKLDSLGNKRKLSKREDPELSLEYYRREGYHPRAVREYLLTLLNSNFEEWRLAHPEAPAEDFPFSLEKMAHAGALFDLNKLNDICKDVLARIPAAELYEFLLDWAARFRPEILPCLEPRDYVERILDLDRTGPKPRKDFITAGQIFDFICYFFDDFFSRTGEYPENMPLPDRKTILEQYLASYDHRDDQTCWFEKIRTLGEALGYAGKPKDYKKNPGLYKGHVGDVSTVIRIAVMGRAQSPDLWEIQQILGEDRVRQRIGDCLSAQ